MEDRVLRKLMPNARACAAALLLIWLSGCAAVSDPAGFAIVTQDKYDFQTCPEIVGAVKAQEARLKELTELSDKGNFLVSAAAYRSELVQARAQLAAANRAAKAKGCEIK
jgi:hypothetical protein